MSKIINIQNKLQETWIRPYFFLFLTRKRPFPIWIEETIEKRGRLLCKRSQNTNQKWKEGLLATPLWRHYDVINDELWKMSHWNSMSQFADNPTRNTSFHAFNSSNRGHRGLSALARPFWWPSVRCALPHFKSTLCTTGQIRTVRIQDWPIRASQMHECLFFSSALPLIMDARTDKPAVHDLKSRITIHFIYLKLINE